MNGFMTRFSGCVSTFMSWCNISARPALSITSLTPREALLELISYSFKLDITDREFLKREFEYLCNLATLPLFYRLIFPRDLSLLPIVEEAILENLNTK